MILCVDGQHTENENTLRRGNVQGADQPYLGELMMAVYRVSEKMRMPFGKDKNGWSITRLCAWYQCEFCPTIFRMQCRSESVTSSCGCKTRQARKEVLTGNTYRRTHFKCGTGAYETWLCMRAGCQQPGHIEYPRYGARGVKVCERWDSFENFLEDMGDRPDGFSIDRIDPNGDYSPENCRWADDKTQARNRRNNRLITIGDRTMTLIEWSEQPGAVGYKLIHNRLREGWSPEDAVFRRLQCQAS